MIGSDEGIKLGYTNGKVFGTIIGNVYVITLGIDVGTDLGSLYRLFMVLMMESLRGYCLDTRWDLLVLYLGSSYVKVIGFDEGIKLGLFNG